LIDGLTAEWYKRSAHFSVFGIGRMGVTDVLIPGARFGTGDVLYGEFLKFIKYEYAAIPFGVSPTSCFPFMESSDGTSASKSGAPIVAGRRLVAF
jgi:hypothetical protein